MEPRVLVVDDERLSRWSISLFLRENGFDVLEASDGKEALALLDRNDVDLVVTDVRMPRLDGLLLRDIISASSPQVSVLLMTAYYPELNMKADPDNVLFKPIQLEELLSTIGRILKHKEDSRSRNCGRGLGDT